MRRSGGRRASGPVRVIRSSNSSCNRREGLEAVCTRISGKRSPVGPRLTCGAHPLNPSSDKAYSRPEAQALFRPNLSSHSTQEASDDPTHFKYGTSSGILVLLEKTWRNQLTGLRALSPARFPLDGLWSKQELEGIVRIFCHALEGKEAFIES